jgi:thioesterase domain-containing protein
MAFEIAQQLQRQGQQVALLALVDLIAPIHNNEGNQQVNIDDPEADDHEAAALTWFISRDLAGGRLAKDLSELYDDIRRLDPNERWNYALEQLKTANVVSLDTEPQEIRRLFLIYKINLETLNYFFESYVPQVYPGQITILPTSDGYDNATDSTIGWSKLSSKPVVVHAIPGDHGTLFLKPNIQVLAERLTYCLDEAQGVNVEK